MAEAGREGRKGGAPMRLASGLLDGRGEPMGAGQAGWASAELRQTDWLGGGAVRERRRPSPKAPRVPGVGGEPHSLCLCLSPQCCVARLRPLPPGLLTASARRGAEGGRGGSQEAGSPAHAAAPSRRRRPADLHGRAWGEQHLPAPPPGLSNAAAGCTRRSRPPCFSSSTSGCCCAQVPPPPLLALGSSAPSPPGWG